MVHFLLVAVSLGSVLQNVAPSKVFQKPNLEDQTYWRSLGDTDLREAMRAALHQNWGVAKNVILFVGDGMGITPTVAARIYKGQQRTQTSGEEGYLVWERFAHNAMLKNYLIDRQVADSAASATAYLTGVKANYFTLGVDHSVKLDNCHASLNPKSWLPSVIDWAQLAGKHTGFVTTTRVTHATPAALYAKTANRDWECDTKLGQYGHGCRDIARQLVENSPGRDIRVILGGGRHPLGAAGGLPEKWSCARGDGRNLTNEWIQNHQAFGRKASYVTNTQELLNVNIRDTDYLMGLFADSHMAYETDRDTTPIGQPSLANMTATAINMLSKNQDGYFLMIEGGRIDHALHITEPKRAMEEILSLEDAVQTAMSLINDKETLLIVTADHSHVMTINGYPLRGNDILGIADTSNVDFLPYNTLMFANGPGVKYYVKQNNVSRVDPRIENTAALGYVAPAGVPKINGTETHSGDDVAVYATGPMSHLFHRVHEQSYVAHAMGFAACIGPHSKNCHRLGYTNP
ncbi:unnamed protein product, partial [Meganyctiphanes norvegica]